MPAVAGYVLVNFDNLFPQEILCCLKHLHQIEKNTILTVSFSTSSQPVVISQIVIVVPANTSPSTVPERRLIYVLGQRDRPVAWNPLHLFLS